MNTIPVLNFAMLDAPSAREVIQEVITEDCYHMDLIPNGSIVIDGGAFYGEFGIACAMTKACHVICVEPSPANYHILQRNAPDGVILLNAAMASSERHESFWDRPNHPAGSIFRSGIPDAIDPNNYIEVSVRCTTVPVLIQMARSLFGDLPICLKLDIEGTEREVFTGDVSWLKDIHYVAMEWHFYDGHFYSKLLKNYGFKVVTLEGSGPPPRPQWSSDLGAGLLVAVKL